MNTDGVSRRRALQIAGVAAIPGVLAGGGPLLSGAAERHTAAAMPNPSWLQDQEKAKESKMQLGAFSVSLTVKDLAASRAFYEKLGFKAFGGDPKQNWQILKNGEHVIGLFQGLFEKNILTFNPGWDQSAQKLESFVDIRELQRELKAQGVKFDLEADEKSKGPASFMITDPDGNQILFDQHV